MLKKVYSNSEVYCKSSNEVGLISSVKDGRVEVDFRNGNKKKLDYETAFETHYLEYVDKGYQKEVEDYFNEKYLRENEIKIKQKKQILKKKKMLEIMKKEKEEKLKELKEKKEELFKEKRKDELIREKESKYTDRLGLHKNKKSYFKMKNDFRNMNNIEKLFTPNDVISSDKETIFINDDSIVIISKYKNNKKEGINGQFNIKEVNGCEYKEYFYKTVQTTIKELKRKDINFSEIINDKKVYLIVNVIDSINYGGKKYKENNYFYYQGEVIDVKCNKVDKYTYFYLTLNKDEDNDKTLKTLCGYKKIKFNEVCLSK